MANDDIDVQFTFQAGLYELTRVRNPKIISFQDEPFGLDPNGCMISMTMNNKVKPFDDPAVRRALNYSIDKQSVNNLAFEGAANNVGVPLAVTFPGPAEYYEKIKDLIDADGTELHNPEKAAEVMEAAGYSKNEAGFWTDPDGGVPQHRALEPGTRLLHHVPLRHSGC